MAKITCEELGILGCDETFTGTSPGDVVREVVEHLRTHHDMDMPDADTILEGDLTENPLDTVDPDVALVITRLREKLNLMPSESQELIVPPIDPNTV